MTKLSYFNLVPKVHLYLQFFLDKLQLIMFLWELTTLYPSKHFLLCFAICYNHT